MSPWLALVRLVGRWLRPAPPDFRSALDAAIAADEGVTLRLSALERVAAARSETLDDRGFRPHPSNPLSLSQED